MKLKPFHCCTGLLVSVRRLRTRLLLLLLVQGEEGDTGDLDDLETDTGQIAYGMAGTTETGDEDLIVFINEVQATIAGNEGGDLLTVLDELGAARLTNSGIRLLGLDTFKTKLKRKK